jgi:large repetitive protein
VPRTARTTSLAVFIGLLATLLPLAAASPASAARVKTIKIADASIVEGDGGPAKTLSLRLTWSGSKGGAAVQVSFATADLTATAGSDYTAKSGVASLSNGCKCATISIPILGDTTTEGTETFAVNLSNPVNAVIGDAQAIGTIYDNEGPPAFVVTDATADESAGTIGFSVLMTNASVATQTVDWSSGDGTAVAGGDYASANGTLTFSAGQTSKTVTISITDDALNEADETFTVNLSNATLALDDASGTGTITDDDPEPSIAIGDRSAAEDAGTLTFTVSLSAISGQEVDVDYTTNDATATATAGGDYTATSGTAVIPAGSTSTTVDVPLLDDSTYEGGETFTLDLSSPFNASTPDVQAVGTITEDDTQPSISIGDASVTEGDTGATPATFTVTLSNPSASATTVDWSTVDATATAGTDYTAASGTLGFPAGVTTKQLAVDVHGDTAVELDETFSVVLSSPPGGTLGASTATGTIVDDDRTASTVTLKVIATKRKVGGKGVLEPATADAKVTVTLYKKKHGSWVAIGTKAVTVTKLGDRDHDGKLDAMYKSAFPRPKKGTYKVTATFAGSATLLSATKTATFKL